ncbi:hypothetical protein [Corynebacterium mastitidis]|uniref:hypothetical protein n=1 Tax=Corynebacterium mastitidis TaxID=161890 RepID=UPI000367536D|nr:hypothetical protein [Corynebacterium mastitidis]
MKKARIGLALCLTAALGLAAPAATAAEAPTELTGNPVLREDTPEGIEGALAVIRANTRHMAQVVERELRGFSGHMLDDMVEGDFDVDHIPGILEREQGIGNHLIEVAQVTVRDSAEALSS